MSSYGPAPISHDMLLQMLRGEQVVFIFQGTIDQPVIELLRLGYALARQHRCELVVRFGVRTVGMTFACE